MRIIKAKKNNSQDVSKIISVLDTKNYDFSSIEKIEKQIEKGWYFLAYQNKEILGAMALRPNEKTYEIYSIASKAKGAGKALINFAIKKCKKDKVKKLWSWSLASYKAKGFYEKMGFEEKYLLKKQWQGKDCYFFGKVIK